MKAIKMETYKNRIRATRAYKEVYYLSLQNEAA